MNTITFRQSYSRDIAGRLLAASSDALGTTSTPLTRHGYRLDELDRRAGTTLLDGSTWTWGYNDRSEVTSAVRRQFDTTEVAPLGATYAYDEIGNRTASTSPILGNFTYTANNTNQYDSITSNDSQTVLGNAPVSPAVTVNGAAVDRTPPTTGTIFHKALTGSNTSDPVWLEAAVSDGSTTQTRHVWLPTATGTPGYSVDGNLTSDSNISDGGTITPNGQWTYIWDAENRLVSMETTIAAVTAGRPFRKLAFHYDWTGRRLARTITDTSNAVLSATRWLYDAWNPIAEYSIQNSTLSIQNSYLWGLDISGTLQGAGGVGGLLSCVSQSSVFLTSFDGNGNITAWTQSGSTTPVCRREYDAFGNIVAEQGTPPCSLGFSTKIEDPETGLLYYGHRYLCPPLGRWLNQDPTEEGGGLNLYGFVGNSGVDRGDYLELWDRLETISIMCQSEKGQEIVAALDKVIVMKSEYARSRRQTRASVNDKWSEWVNYDWGAMTDENDNGKKVIHIPETLSDQDAAVALAHESAHADGSQKGYSWTKAEMEAYAQQTVFTVSIGLPPEERNWIWDKKQFPEKGGAVNKQNILSWVRKTYSGYYSTSDLVRYEEEKPGVPAIRYGKETVEAPWRCPEAPEKCVPVPPIDPMWWTADHSS